MAGFLHHTPDAQPARARDWLWLALAGLAGLAWFHRVDWQSGFTQLTGDVGDTRLIAFLLEHQWQALRGLVPWASPPMFHPVQGTLGYADAFWLHGLVFWPMRAAGCDVLTALQGATLFWNAATFAAMAWFLRGPLRLGTLASAAGALVFAFNSPKFHQFVHLQLQPLALLPLLFALLLDVGRRGQQLAPRAVFVRLALAALLVDLQLMSGVYVALYLWLLLLLLLGLALAVPQSRAWLLALSRARWRVLLAALGVLVLGLLPFLWLYVPVLRQAGGRSFGDAQPMIPHWYSLVAMGDRHWLWGFLEPAMDFATRPFFWEHRVGLGLVLTAGWLAITARVVRAWYRRRTEPLPPAGLLLALLVAAVCAFYALGMSYAGHSPWWFVLHGIPGMKAIRAVSRYVIVLAAPIAIVWAWTLDWLGTRGRRMRWLAAVLAVLAASEQVGSTWGVDKAAALARIGRLAAALPQTCSTFYVTSPADAQSSIVSVHIDAMWVAQQTGIPTLNGYSGQDPPGWRGLFFLRDPGYPAHVAAWLAEQRVEGPVCVLPVEE